LKDEKMKLHRLLNTLEALKKNLFDLHSNLKMQQNALTTNNADEIQNAIIEQEKILHNIRNCEQQRLLFMSQIFNSNEFNLEHNSISSLLVFLKNTDLENHNVLFALKNDITNLMDKINILNGQNSYIIENARKFIRDLMQNLYDISKKNFLDRKV